MKSDVIVLGAGAVGTATAVHLQARGRQVVLVDRNPQVSETSYGNAGLIQRESVYPYAFPRHLGTLLKYGLKRAIDTNYHFRELVRVAPFMLRYLRHSHPTRHAAIAKQYATLIEHCLDETSALASDAGVGDLLRPTGWLKLFRTQNEQNTHVAEAAEWAREFGVRFRSLDRAELHAVEPHLAPSLAGALHYPDPLSVSDPGRLIDGWRHHFERLGGTFVAGDAVTCIPDDASWRVTTNAGVVEAPAAVVALGPWAKAFVAGLGYRLLLGGKRGYHMHYRLRDGAVLNRPVLDVERGFMLAPMTDGVRLTTGVEFARQDAPKTPVQLARAEPLARLLLPLGERVHAEPWMGVRPCTPDMMPVIGPAPRHPGLWFGFGHAHHGLTLGAVTGRLLAEMVTGETPFVDPTPFRADRPALAT